MTTTEAYFVGLVLTDTGIAEQLVEAWAAAGASGVTALDCEGESLKQMHRFQQDDTPLFPSLSSLLSGNNTDQKFVFTIVEGKDSLNRLLEVTQKVTGDLSKPGRGILFAWPIGIVMGLG